MILIPGQTSLRMLEDIWKNEGPVSLHLDMKKRIDDARSLVVKAAEGEKAVYGVNTGFGKLASIKIAKKDTVTLQRNLVLSHCCGVGTPLDLPTTRLMMSLKLLSLGRGASGVEWDTVILIQELISRGVFPVIPDQGSVGASGDLAPLAHMAALMIGEGEAIFEGNRMPGKEALKAAGVGSISLGSKEGLALINGTQFSTACALAGLFKAWTNASSAIVTAALSTDAIMGSTAPLADEIHMLRGHKGQISVARSQEALLNGSEIREAHLNEDNRVQDPYSFRCQPQVTGAALDLLWFSGRTLEIEANAATDNPLVLIESGSIVSGGNFHAEPVGFAADIIAMAISEIGAIAQRRVALMVDPVSNYNLPAFLTSDPGLNSGLMIADVTSAALMSENKHLANPCTTDSTPTSANQEDHVSMAANAARRLDKMNVNLNTILGIEAMCAVEGIDFRRPLKTGKKLESVIARFRKIVPALKQDRFLSKDIINASKMIEDGSLIIGMDLPNHSKEI